jgi:hypothetical protein
MGETKGKISISLIIAALVLFLYYFKASEWSESGRLSNIKLYIIGAVVFFVIFITGYLIEQTIAKNIHFPPLIEKIGAVLLIAWGGYYAYKSFFLELDNWPYYPASYMRHNIPVEVYVFVMIFGVITSYLLIKKDTSRNKWIRIVFSLLIISLQTWFLYAPNFFKDSLGGLYHMDAYTNSIINALNFSSFEQYSMSIYGHYGILFIIPVKLLQLLGFNQWISVTLSIALVGGIVFAIEYWVISQVIDNDTLFLIAVLASSIVSVQIYYNQFYQMLPHRYVFQAIILAGVAFVYKSESKKRKIIKSVLWILAGVAVVWNTETGIVSAAVWMLGSLYLDTEALKKYTVKIIIKNVVLLLVAIAGAYGFVNLYNIIVGGNTITFGTFLYPLGSKSYPVENIQLPLQIPWAGYFIPVLLLLCTLGYFFVQIIKVNLNRLELVVVLGSVMGIGVYTYYMNRAVSSNASIVSFSFILVVSYMVDRNLRKESLTAVKKISFATVGSVMCLLVLVSMALSSVATFGLTLAGKNQTTYERESLDKFVEEIRGRIPDGTVAFGIGTAQLFSYMDLNTGIYIADWEDLDKSINKETVINQDALDHLTQKLATDKYPYIFVNETQAGYIPTGYVEIDHFEYGDYTFKLYENRHFIPYHIGDYMFFYGDKYNARDYIISGMSGVEESFTWTEGNNVEFEIPIDNVTADGMNCSINLAAVFNGEQSVEAYVNDELVYSDLVTSVSNKIEFKINKNDSGLYNIRLVLPDAISPKEIGQSEDPRCLALAIQFIQITSD